MKKSATKTNAGNKFLLCCRPVDDMDGVLESRVVIKRSNHRSLLCSSAEDTAIVKSAAIKSVSSDGGLSKKSLNLVLHHSHRTPKRKLPRVIQAVVFEIILRKGVYRRKVEGPDCNGTSKCIADNEKSLNDIDETDQRTKQDVIPDTDIAEGETILKSPNSLPFSENNASRSVSNNEARQNRSMQDSVTSKKMSTDHMDCYIFYVLLAVVTFTVIWGKLGGILCTSVWLYYHSYQQTSYSRLLRRSSRQGGSKTLFQKERNAGVRKLPHRRTTTL